MNNKFKHKAGYVSIIIVSWNGKHWLERCLPSIKKQTYKLYEIILVDNGSSDDTVVWIKKKYPEIKLVVLDNNYGFAEANNIGFLQSQGEFVYFVNNDTELASNSIEELVFGLQSNPDIAGGQSKILLLEKKDKLDTVGAYFTYTGFLYHNLFGAKDNPLYDKQILFYSCKGASMIFRKKILINACIEQNLFDKEYFAYFEETDLCHRIWLLGYKVAYFPKAVIYHRMGATSNLININYIQYHSFKNRISTYIKNFSTPILVRLLPIHILVCIIYVLISLFKGQFLLSASIIKGIIWNLINLSSLLRKRSFIQNNIRKVSDDSFINLITYNPPIRYFINWARGIYDQA